MPSPVIGNTPLYQGRSLAALERIVDLLETALTAQGIPLPDPRPDPKAKTSESEPAPPVDLPGGANPKTGAPEGRF